MGRILPHKIMIYGWFIWLLFFLISPYDYYNIKSFGPAIILLIAYNVALFVGLYIPRKKLNDFAFQKIEINEKKIRRLFAIALIAGLVGNALNVYVKVSMIDIFSLENGEENRMAIVEMGEFSGNPLSVVAALLYPFSIVAFMLAMYFRQYFKRLPYIVAIVSGIFPGVFLLLLGARSSLFFFIMLAVFTMVLRWLAFSTSLKVVNFKRKLQLAGLAVLMVFIFAFVQNNRTKVIGVDEQLLFNLRAETQEWRYNPEASINNVIGDKPYLYSGFLDFIHYYVHGVFEFVRLYNFTEGKNSLLYGKYESYVILKFFKLFNIDIGESYTDLNKKHFYKPAVYTTFWGPFFVDFGVYGIALALLIGWYIKSLFFKLQSGKLAGLLLYPFILSAIFSIPIVNSVAGQNTYLLVSIALSLMLYKYLL